MRKNLKVSLIGIVLLVMILLCACGTKAEGKTEERRYMEFVGKCDNAGYTVIWRDGETGVHYIKTSHGYICPRYNADGTLYVD